MNIHKIMPAITAVAFLLLCSCSTTPKIPKEDLTETVSLQSDPNHYFYYMEAQLARTRGDLNAAVSLIEKAIAMDPASAFLRRELAAYYIEMRKIDEAAAVAEQVLSEYPEDVDALILYGKISQILTKNAQATAAFEKAIELDAKREPVYTILGRIYLSENDLGNALRVYQRLVKHFPASFVGYFFIGKIYVEQAETKAAIDAFEKTLQLEPDLLEPRFELIQIYEDPETTYKNITVSRGDTLSAISKRLYGRYDEKLKNRILTANPELKDPAKIKPGMEILFPNPELPQTGTKRDNIVTRLYEEILKLSPGNVKAMADFGLHELRTGDTAAAEKIFQNLAERSRTEKAVMTTIVQQYFEKKRYSEIESILTQMLKSTPDEGNLHYILGLTLSEQGKNDQALDHFMAVGASSDFYTNAAINIAFVYQQKEDINAAIAFLEEKLAEMPDQTEFMLYLGTFFEEKEEFEKAEEILKKGTEIEADNAKLLFRLGVVYDKQGKKDACIETMKAVIEIEPENATALNYLGYTYAEMGENLEEAERLIRRALEKKPDDGYITDSLGWVFYQRGMYEKALEIIEKAVKLVPDDPIILEHLGDVYLKLDRKEEALDAYRRSLEKHKKKNDSDVTEKIRLLVPEGQRR